MEEGTARDAAAKVGEMANNAASQPNVRDKVEQGKAMWQEAKAGAADAMGKASSVARDMSAAGAQAASQAGETIQGAARQVGTQATQAANTLYEQGTNASGYVSRYAAEQPWTALLVAAAVGYGLAYLIHRP
jgi:ElaB/YqjD/DUF883 family membrane-anchored ribosome-binding protein